MAMNQEQYDELVMNIIVEGGNARSLAMETIQEGMRRLAAYMRENHPTVT